MGTEVDRLPVREVHNAWTVTGGETPIAEHRRPQDWGSPRWKYHRYRFEMELGGIRYINHFHGWTDLELEPYQYPELFARVAVLVLMPGTPPELCGREYLEEEDFWQPEWGAPPPFYEPDADDEEEQ